jgi:putative phosphoribosyl transferase
MPLLFQMASIATRPWEPNRPLRALTTPAPVVHDRPMFHDRTQAGAALAAALPDFRRKPNVTVIGLARGGVEVAAETARLLDLPLDVLCVRKVASPDHPELAMGAVAPLGERYTNRRVAARLTPAQVDQAYDVATAQAREMDERLRNGMSMMLVGRTAVIVDDGAATGASIRAALAAVRNAGARQTVIALPVLPRLAVERLERECDRLVTLRAPQRFHAVSQFYKHFEEVSEARVLALLSHAKPAFEMSV